MKNTYKKLISEINTYFSVNKFQKAVVGLSGGLDSSVTASLLVDAIGKNKVIGLIMPEKGITSEKNIRDAVNLCKKLKMRCELVEINDFLKPYENVKWKQSKIALINTKARIRANLLYNFANTHNAMVAGTSNKSELLLGYGTKYGDLACDLFIIGDIFKTDIIKLARYMDLPENLIRKKPSAELYRGQTDQEELGAPYKTLDGILRMIIEGKNYYQIIKKYNKKIVRDVFERIKSTEHKRKQASVIKVD